MSNELNIWTKINQIEAELVPAKPLYITRNIPAGSVILLVDPDYKYIDDELEWTDDEEAIIVRKNLDAHISNIVKYVAELKRDGHIIAATKSSTYWNDLLPFIDVHLPYWDVYKNGEHSLHEDIISFAKGKEIVVGGLWLEMCVFEVSSKLQERYGNKVKLFQGEHLSISYTETYMIPEDDMLTLKDVCEENNLYQRLF